MPDWKKGKGLILSEPAYIMELARNDSSFVLIDLRAPGQAKSGHITGAVAIELSSLKDAEGMFPADKAAPIILYSEKTPDTDAYLTVAGWGYKNVSLMNNGMNGWLAAKGTLVTGNPAAKIEYVKKIPKNQIGIEEFKSIAENRPSDKVILDVRDPDTTVNGSLTGAITIPLDSLESRMGEIPKDKEVIIHCNTGIMAGMAQKTLQEKGYRTRILNAVIQVAPDGSYEITEK